MQDEPQSLPPLQPTLESLVEKAKAGNRGALEQVVRRIQDRIYRLALRMLFHPADAEDACQEILIQLITHLDSFEGRSSFSTWVYRVASNHLLNTRQRRAERSDLNFEYVERALHNSMSPSPRHAPNHGDRRLLVTEAKLVCTQIMLLALRRDIRLAFILGEIFGASSREGADILDITPETFRQRLSRGRKQIRDFMTANCSLVVPENPCHCAERVEHFTRLQCLDPNNPLFVSHRSRSSQPELNEPPMTELDQFDRITAIFRSHPQYAAPEAFVDIIRELLDSDSFRLFTTH